MTESGQNISIIVSFGLSVALWFWPKEQNLIWPYYSYGCGCKAQNPFRSISTLHPVCPVCTHAAASTFLEDTGGVGVSVSGVGNAFGMYLSLSNVFGQEMHCFNPVADRAHA